MAQTNPALQRTDSTLAKPYKKGNWLIFPNTFPIDAGKGLLDCEGNIDGICTHADSVEDCMKQCDEASRNACDYGYFISKPVKICMPRMSASFYPHMNPTLTWASKNENDPMLKGIEMTAFIDTSGFQYADPYNPKNQVFPDPYNNSVFFRDQIYLKNIETNTKLFTPSTLITSSTSEIPFIYFSPDQASPLVVGFPNPYNKDVTLFSDLPYYEAFVLTLNDTSLIFRNFGDYIGWILRGDIEIFPGQRLRAIPVKENEKHIHVAYGAPFYLRWGNKGYLGLDSEKRLKLYNNTLENLHAYGNPITFTFESLMSVYVCQDKKCIEVPQNELEAGKAISNFKGQPAYRSPTCFGVCKYDLQDVPKWTMENALLSPNGIGKQMIIILAILVVLIILFIMLLWFFKKDLRTFNPVKNKTKPRGR